MYLEKISFWETWLDSITNTYEHVPVKIKIHTNTHPEGGEGWEQKYFSTTEHQGQGERNGYFQLVFSFIFKLL